jgi:hypothetical protein
MNISNGPQSALIGCYHLLIGQSMHRCIRPLLCYKKVMVDDRDTVLGELDIYYPLVIIIPGALSKEVST